jgi:hypothetical protein
MLRLPLAAFPQWWSMRSRLPGTPGLYRVAAIVPADPQVPSI